MIGTELQKKIEEALIPYRGLSPIEIAEELGIEIKFKHLQDEYAGAIKKESGRVIMLINSNHNDYRKIFSIAHELGHFFLHQDDLEKGIVSYRHKFYTNLADTRKNKELEANHFAAELLMPKKDFLSYFEDCKGLSLSDQISYLSGKFPAVSRDAIRMRLAYLNSN